MDFTTSLFSGLGSALNRNDANGAPTPAAPLISGTDGDTSISPYVYGARTGATDNNMPMYVGLAVIATVAVFAIAKK